MSRLNDGWEYKTAGNGFWFTQLMTRMEVDVAPVEDCRDGSRRSWIHFTVSEGGQGTRSGRISGMVSANSYLLMALLSATPGVELWEFTAPWCHSCREMEPVVTPVSYTHLTLPTICSV